MAPAILTIRVAREGDAYKVFASHREQQVVGDLGDLPNDFKAQIAPLQEAILRTTTFRRNATAIGAIEPAIRSGLPYQTRGARFQIAEGADARILQEVGAKLFDCIFRQEIYKIYREAYDDATRHRRQLPIKLCIECAELSFIPWEAIFDRNGHFHLSCSLYTPFVRAADLTVVDKYIYSTTPIRILGVVSKPPVLGNLDSGVEQAAITKALKGLEDRGLVKLCWTTSGTFDELKRRLIGGDDNESWNVMHFIGHGDVGRLAMEVEPHLSSIRKAPLDNATPMYDWAVAAHLKITSPKRDCRNPTW